MDSEGIEFLKNELECTVCYDASSSPIHSCKNGHILCGFCFESVNKCVLCQAKFSPCDFAERLVKRHDIKTECKNMDSGCQQLIRLDLLREHLKICEYSAIKRFGLTEFSQYLITHHKIINHSAQNSPIWEFTLDMSAVRVNNIEATTFIYESHLFHYKDEKFLFLTGFHNGTLICWVTVLGEQKKATEFAYMTILRKDNDSLCLWMRRPVLPIHGHCTVNEVIESGEFAQNVHSKARKKYLIVHKNSKNFKMHTFSMEVKMTHLLPTA